MQRLLRKNRPTSYMRKGRTRGTGAPWSTPEPSLSAIQLNTFIKDLKELRDNGTLSEAQFDQVVALACSVYVEREVEKQVGKVLEEKLSPERLARYLSPSI